MKNYNYICRTLFSKTFIGYIIHKFILSLHIHLKLGIDKHFAISNNSLFVVYINRTVRSCVSVFELHNFCNLFVFLI